MLCAMLLCYMHHMEYFLTSSKPSTTSTWGVNRHSPACQSLWNINDSASCDLNRFDAYHFVSIDTDVLSHGCMVCTATPSHWPCYLEDPPEERQDANKVMILYRYLQIFMNLIFLIFWCVPFWHQFVRGLKKPGACLMDLSGSVCVKHGDKATGLVLWKNELLTAASSFSLRFW